MQNHSGKPVDLVDDIPEHADERRRFISSQEQLRLITDAMPAFIAYVDTNLCFHFLNKSYEEWFGVRFDPSRSLTARQVLGTKVFKLAKPYMERALTGESVSYDNTLRHERGDMRHVHVEYVPDKAPDGTVRGFVTVGTDVTKRKQAELELRASEQRFRFMAESLPQKIFTVSPDGTMSYYNQQWQDYTGLNLDELINDSHKRDGVVHPDDYAGAIELWRNNFKAGKPIEYEYRLRDKAGKYRWHISRVNPMKDADGNLTMWIGSSTDIDDMKRATEERLELEVQAARLTEQSAQLIALNQAKDDFISLASHQLRTPATGVKQYLGMLLQGFAGPITGEQKAFLETAYESNERQIAIVNDLLKVASIDAGKVSLQRRKTDLVRLVKSVINEHTSKFNDRQQVVLLQTEKDTVTAMVDGDRIRMVLDNIIDNAIKYTETGKRITVKVGERPGWAVVSVTDQGVGMSAADAERIFYKFSRLDDPLAKGVEGSGLGLYWAQKLVDLHQGTIKVRSKPGRGTTFSIRLPQL